MENSINERELHIEYSAHLLQLIEFCLKVLKKSVRNKTHFSLEGERIRKGWPI